MPKAESIGVMDAKAGASQTTKRFTGWYLEYTDVNPKGMPAVQPAQRFVNGRWLKYISPVKMTKTIQELLWGVLKHFNPLATIKKFADLFKHDIAFCNFNGFGRPGDPRWNFISGADAGSPLPKLMDGIIMRGQLYHFDATWTFQSFLEDAFILAKDIFKNREVFSVMGPANVINGAWQSLMENNTLVARAGVHAMDAHNPVSVGEAIDNGWCFRAMSYHETRAEDFFPNFGGEFWVLYVINEPAATYPMHQFRWWDEEFEPDPLKIGG